jgi:hypothetical protein
MKNVSILFNGATTAAYAIIPKAIPDAILAQISLPEVRFLLRIAANMAK